MGARSLFQLPVTDAVALVQTAGLPALCRALFNSNEFLFLP